MALHPFQQDALQDELDAAYAYRTMAGLLLILFTAMILYCVKQHGRLYQVQSENTTLRRNEKLLKQQIKDQSKKIRASKRHAASDCELEAAEMFAQLFQIRSACYRQKSIDLSIQMEHLITEKYVLMEHNARLERALSKLQVERHMLLARLKQYDKIEKRMEEGEDSGEHSPNNASESVFCGKKP